MPLTLKHLLLFVLLFVSACAPHPASGPKAKPALSAGPVTTAPGFYRIPFGALQLTSLRDGGYVTPNDGADFGSQVGPAAVAKLLKAAGAPTDRISLSVDALLVRMPGHLVLLDTGLGPTDHGVLSQSLALAGVTPAQITDVLITHDHIDHVGGLVTSDGKPAFPNAVIHISAKEWPVMQRGEPTKTIAAAVAGQVKTFDSGQPILPGITPVALYGHTPGHTGYEIASNGHALEDIGDVAHSSIVNLGEPAWRGGMDEDPAAGAATRVKELARLAATHQMLFSPHFPWPGIGRIEAKGDGYVWKPEPGG